MTSLLAMIGVIFAQPLAVAAVAGGAAAIPVIIHLLNRKRYVVVNWAAMRFLLAAQRKNTRRLKLEQWLLLATRMLLGILLVLAMAAVSPWAERIWQRFFPGTILTIAHQGRTHRIIVIDGSYTMTARRDDERTRLDHARDLARELIANASPGDGFSLFHLTSPMQPLVPGPAEDREKILRQLEEIPVTHGSADVVGGLRAIADLVNKPLGKFNRREVYFLSDLRRSGWPMPAGEASKPADASPLSANSAAASWGRIFANARVIFLDVAGRDEDNLAITSLAIGDNLPLANQDLAVTVQLQLFGRQPREKVPVELLVGKAGDRGPPKAIAQKLVDLPVNTSVTVNFALDRLNRLRDPGQYLFQVRAGEDRLQLDNTRSMIVTLRDTVPVMIVNGKPSPEPLDRAGEFLKRALNPFPEGERSPESPARVVTLNPREFQDAGLGNLFKPDAPTDVVYLCDVPAIGGNEVARLEAHLKRGGSVVIGLGPNSAKNLEAYNRVLYDDGKGILPGPLTGVRRAENNQFYTLLADDESLKRPPLLAFRSDQERASLATPHFTQFVRMELPPNSTARRIFSFLPSEKAGKGDRLEPAVVEWSRHRGRVVVVTTSLNADWNEWPRTLSYAPFMQELLRMCVADANRLTVLAGDSVEQYVSPQFVGLSALLTRTGDSDFSIDPTPIALSDEAGLARFPRLDLAGVYRFSIGSRQDNLVSVNVPLVSGTGGGEADLRRWNTQAFRELAPDADVQVVGQLGEIQRATGGADTETEIPSDPRGPSVARMLGLLLLALIVFESVLALKYGSARAGTTPDPTRVKPLRWSTPLWLAPLIVAAAVLAVVLHAIATGEFLGFLSPAWRQPAEAWLGVPEAGPGEGTRWRIDTRPYLSGESSANWWLVGALSTAMVGFVVWVYRKERLADASMELAAIRQPRWRLILLRSGMILALLWVVLPQTKLIFERESWPDVVVMLDESRSMSVVDEFHDPKVRAAAEDLKKAWAELAAPSIREADTDLRTAREQLAKAPAGEQPALRERIAGLEARLLDLRTPHRLNLIKAMLARRDARWLQTLVGQRQMRVHVYRAASVASPIATLDNPEACDALLKELMEVRPTGDSSLLGNDVATVLKTFRGNSLNAIIMFTDGVNTAGEDWSGAARQAAKAGVPLHLIGVGDAAETPDLAITELRAEDTINLNDRLVMVAKVRSQGPGLPDSVPVIISEIREGKRVEIARETLRLDPTGKPAPVKFVHQPKEAGEKTFVIEVPAQAEEPDQTNNAVEHRVFVAEARRLKVLMVEGYPRYDYRYVKSLFERESDAVKGNKAVELEVFLASAQADAPKQDRTLIGRFPSSEELKKYDLVILGDVDFMSFPKGEQAVDSLAKFVRDTGGGLLMLAGEQANPHSYRDTPLNDIMPVVCDGPPPEPAEASIRESYRPKLTTAGQTHPLFRFSTEEVDNAEIWNRLSPLFWYSKGYRRKLSAEALAVHPDRPAEAAAGQTSRDENHPLVLQQFVGSGRVMFVGFDDTWRWRLLQDEPRFNQFWMQAIRTLARGRVGRIEVRTDRKTYRRDEPMRVSVRYPDEIPAPASPVKVSLSRVPPSRPGAPAVEIESQTLELALKEGTRGTYETILTRTPEGDYNFALGDVPNGTIRPKAEARVYPPPGELDRVRLEEADLRRAGRESGGKYYGLDEAEAIPDELPGGARVALDQPGPPWLIWNHEVILGMLIALWTAEWLMRKRWRLL